MARTRRRPSPNLDNIQFPERPYFDTGSARRNSNPGPYHGPLVGDGVRELIFEASLYPEDRFRVTKPRDKWEDT